MSKDLNFGFPFVQTMALANAVFLMYLVLSKRIGLAVFVWLFLTFITARGDPYTTKETDYQAIMYHLTSFAHAALVLGLLWNDLKKKLPDNRRVVYSAMLLFLGIYSLALLLYFTDKWWDKTYQKYMGKQSLIYDRPPIATVVTKLLSKNDYYFIGPFDFEDQLYMQNKPASKYIVVLPGMGQSDQIKAEILGDLQKNRPPVVVFATEYQVYGSKPGQFVVDYLNQEYFNLESAGVPCNGYRAKDKWFDYYDFERHFFFDKNSKDTVWQKLLDLGLIEKIDAATVLTYPRCVAALNALK
jgi:hypothetical protein